MLNAERVLKRIQSLESLEEKEDSPWQICIIRKYRKYCNQSSLPTLRPFDTMDLHNNLSCGLCAREPLSNSAMPAIARNMGILVWIRGSRVESPMSMSRITRQSFASCWGG